MGITLAALNSVDLRRREAPQMTRSDKLGLVGLNCPIMMRIMTWSIVAVGPAGLMLQAHADCRLLNAPNDDRSKARSDEWSASEVYLAHQLGTEDFKGAVG